MQISAVIQTLICSFGAALFHHNALARPLQGAATDFTTSQHNISRQLLWGQHLRACPERAANAFSYQKSTVCAQTPSPALSSPSPQHHLVQHTPKAQGPKCCTVQNMGDTCHIPEQ